MLGRIVEAAHIQEEPVAIQVGDLEIRPADGLCLAGGKALTLSVREFQLLVALARRAHGIVDDLTRGGYLTKTRVGRRNEYAIQPHRPLAEHHADLNGISDLATLVQTGGAIADRSQS